MSGYSGVGRRKGGTVDDRPPQPWYEKLFDQDSQAGPVIVIALVVLVVVIVAFVAPKMQQWIEGSPPSSYAPTVNLYRAVARRNVVLQTMVTSGALDARSAERTDRGGTPDGASQRGDQRTVRHGDARADVDQ